MRDLKDRVKIHQNFPKEGIDHYDIMPLLRNAQSLQDAMKYFAIRYKGRKIDKVVGIEGRGFIIGSTLAFMLGVGFVPIRKPNKLPGDTERIDFALEYGTDSLEIQKDSIRPGEKVLLVNDQLGSGNAIKAAAQLIETLGADVIECAFLLSQNRLNGQNKLKEYNIFAMLEYE